MSEMPALSDCEDDSGASEECQLTRYSRRIKDGASEAILANAKRDAQIEFEMKCGRT
jgi:hypothetical protein